MLKSYYVNRNAQSGGEHEVHAGDCDYLPDKENMIYLGQFTNCHDAVAEARRNHFNNVDGCYYCCRPCHTR